MKSIIFNLFLLLYVVYSQDLEYTESEFPESIVLNVILSPNKDYNMHVNEKRLVITLENGITVFNYSLPQYVVYDKIKVVYKSSSALIVIPKRIFEREIYVNTKQHPVIIYKDIDIQEQIRLFGVV